MVAEGDSDSKIYAGICRPREEQLYHFYDNLSRTLRAAFGGGWCSCLGLCNLKIYEACLDVVPFTENF